MNILIDIGHPAHVHLFKKFIEYLKAQGYEVTVTSRDKDITIDLLDKFGIEHKVLTKAGKNLISQLIELIIRDIQIYILYFKKHFDAAFGTSVSIAHLSALTKVKSYVFSEDDDIVVPLFATITYPFATKIIVPKVLMCDKWMNKRVFHNSSHKLAYLHPNNFTPNEKIIEKYGLKKRNYIIVRKSSLKAHHDINAKGIETSFLKEIINIASSYKIIDTKEEVKNNKISIEDMHHVLAFAKMLICDSQSMSLEAAILGVPVIRITSFSNKIGIINEFEKKYKLIYSFKPHEKSEILKKINEMLKNPNLLGEFQNRQSKMLQEKDDFNDWLINYFEKNISTKHV